MTERPVKTILHVEDDYSIRMSIEHILQDEGYIVHSASNGREALDFLSTHPNEIDLIFIDVMMPVMDGFAFCAEQSKDKSIAHIPVIVYSADERNKSKAESIGLQFISKPFSINDLFEGIARYAGK